MITNNTFLKLIGLMLSMLFFSYTLSAQYFKGPVARGFGGASVAGTESPEVLFINPAAVAHGRALDMSIFYEAKDKFQGVDNSAYGIAIVDNTEKILFSGGVGYIKNRIARLGAVYSNESYLTIAGAYSYSNDLSLGVSLVNLESSTNVVNEYNQVNASLGLQYITNQQFIWGLSAQNLLSVDEDIAEAYRLKKRVQLGGQWIYNAYLRFRFDINSLLDSTLKNKEQYMMGLESQVGAYLVIRVGYRADKTIDDDFGAFGISFKGPRLSVDYTVEKSIKSGLGQMHSVDFRVPIW